MQYAKMSCIAVKLLVTLVRRAPCVQATPNADTALLFFETNKLGFTPEVLGRIRSASPRHATWPHEHHCF